jgi:hypothetical protein
VPFGHTGQKQFALGGTPPPSTHKLKNQAGHLFIYLFIILFFMYFSLPSFAIRKLGMGIGVHFFF